MKTLSAFFIASCLANFLAEALPSNPDSEMVQNDSFGDARQKSSPLQHGYSQARSADLQTYSETSDVRVFVPFLNGSRTKWREFVPQSPPNYIRRRGSSMISLSGISWSEHKNKYPDLFVRQDTSNDMVGNKPVISNGAEEPLRRKVEFGERLNGNLSSYLEKNNLSSNSNTHPNGPNYAPVSLNDDRNEEETPTRHGFASDPNVHNSRRPSNSHSSSNRSEFSDNASDREVRRNISSSNSAGRPPFPLSSEGPRDTTVDNSEVPPSGPVDTQQQVPIDVPVTSRHRASADMNLLAGVVNDFAFKMMDALNLESNFVISPFSIFVALSMCYLGSDGATKAQLENALGLNNNSIHGELVHRSMKDMLSLILPHSGEYELYIANAMFLAQNFTVNPQFEQNIQRFYGAELKNLDFGNPQLSVQVINDWVSKNTRNTITSLTDIPPPVLTRLLLLNAMYFKGVWKTQFPPDMTYTGRFFNLDDSISNVPTMPLYGETFPYFQSGEHKHSFIKLPYKGDQVSMIIALPNEMNVKPMPSVTDQILCHVRDALKKTRLDTVSLPKFRVEYVRSLKEPLKLLGISDLFNPYAKNLTGIRKENDLHVSAVLHKAIIEVNEQGATAAATTSVQFVPLSFRNTTDFVADHPFAFYIVHEPSGLVLFYGKIFSFGGKPVATASTTTENKNTAPSGGTRKTSSSGGFRRIPVTPSNPRNSLRYQKNSGARIHGAVMFRNEK